MVMTYGDAYDGIHITVPISDLELIWLNQRPVVPRGQSQDLNPTRLNTSLFSHSTGHTDNGKCLLSIPILCQAWLHHLCVDVTDVGQTLGYISHFVLSLKDFITAQQDKMGDLPQVSRAPNLGDAFSSLIFNLWFLLPAIFFTLPWI